ncbi:MAG: hypothetical protein KDD47_27105, partial [Acidobacteria bacterium]|nr:hypothetical protein [Acidobacteriota bacterium]
EEAFEALLRQGSPELLLAFLRGRDEAFRRRLRPAARRFQREATADRLSNPGAGPRFLARLALLGTETWSRLKRPAFWEEDGTFLLRAPTVESPEIRVLLDRRPPWLGEWASWLAARPERRLRRYWKVLRQLERQGQIAAPAGEAYVLGFFEGAGHDPPTLLATLEEDPGLLEAPFWDLFELATDDSDTPREAWLELIPRLAEEGRLDRETLLASCLRALGGDPRPSWGRFFQRLYRSLRPTAREVVQAREELVALLESRNPQVRASALELVRKHVVGELPAGRIAAALGALAGGSGKAAGLAALRLLRDLAEGDPALIPACSEVLVQAVASPQADVQAEALDRVEEWRLLSRPEIGAKLGEALEARASLVAPAHRRRLAAMLQGVREGGTESGCEEGDGGTVPEDLEDLARRIAALDDDLRRAAGLEGASALLRKGVLPEGLLQPSEASWGAIPRLDPVRKLEPV